MKENAERKALRLVKWISNHASDGIGPLSSAHDRTDDYLLDQGHKSDSARVDVLINWETSKNFTSGFTTSLGGVLVRPVALPAGLAADLKR